MSTNPLPLGGQQAPPDAALADRLSVLLARVASGEDAALAEVYDLTAAKLYGLASSIVCNSQDAEEVVCDAFVQIWSNVNRYDCARGSALGWMLTICRSRAVDRWRRNRAGRLGGAAEGVVSEDPDELAPDDLLQALERDSAVFRAMARLSPLRRRLLALAFFQGLTHEEIAGETCLPVGTVKSHIRRALTNLRSALGERGSGARSD